MAKDGQWLTERPLQGRMYDSSIILFAPSKLLGQLREGNQLRRSAPTILLEDVFKKPNRSYNFVAATLKTSVSRQICKRIQVDLPACMEVSEPAGLMKQ